MKRRLTEAPFDFDFFQAVRLLERWACLAPRSDDVPQSRAVGYDFNPAEEVVRFRSLVSLAFPSASVQDLKWIGKHTPHQCEMTVTFLGLTTDGVLPQHYTTLLLNRIRQRDLTLRDFLDLFNHRMVSLFYRAWEKYRFALQYERARPLAAHSQRRVLQLGLALKLTNEDSELRRAVEQRRRLNRNRLDSDEGLPPLLDRAAECATQLESMGLRGNDAASILREIRRLRGELSSPYGLGTPFTHALYCLTGLGHSGLRGRMEFEDEAILYYAGNFARHSRNVTSLQRMIGDYFGVPIGIRQFEGTWLMLDPDDQSRLPWPARPGGLNCGLGTTLVLGQRVWDVEGRFTVQLGPLNYAQFRQYLPTGEAMRPLQQMIRFYVGPQFDFDVQLILRAQDVPCCRLGSADEPASRLGWDTWLHGGRFPHEARDSVFSCEG